MWGKRNVCLRIIVQHHCEHTDRKRCIDSKSPKILRQTHFPVKLQGQNASPGTFWLYLAFPGTHASLCSGLSDHTSHPPKPFLSCALTQVAFFTVLSTGLCPFKPFCLLQSSSSSSTENLSCYIYSILYSTAWHFTCII